MTTIYAAARMLATDYVFGRNVDQRLIYDLTNQYLQARLVDVAASERIFVSESTSAVQERYQLPGTGMMTKRADGVRGIAVRPYGSFTVAYPLEDFSEQVVGTDVERAYMTAQEFQRHVDGVIARYITRRRFDILRRLFKSTTDTFIDPRHGSLTVQPLANGDTVTYPPVLGSDTAATENHYIETGYAAADISDSNNPCITVRDELEEHFGAMTGGSNIAMFVNNAQRAVLENLTDFTPVPDNYVRVGDNVDVPTTLPTAPGRILGRAHGVWVIEWRYIPANYALGVHLDAEAPLKERVDPAETGLPQGLTLMPTNDQYPFESAEWRTRYGVGTANRLNGVALEFGTGGTYTIPTAFA